MSRISVGRVDLNRRPHALYRFFDRSDVLLYVGITVDIPARFTKHRTEKPWWTEVSNMTIENFGSRREALEAEREAIQNERPLYNIDLNLMVQAGDEDECPANCNQWQHGRNDFALTVIDYLGEAPGSDRFNVANQYAKDDLAENPEGERNYLGEDEVESTAYALAWLVGDELRAFEACANIMLRRMPAAARRELRTRVLDDFRSAGEPEPSDHEALGHMVAHAGRLIAELMWES